MNVMSIYYGHNCTVALSKNGKVIFAQSEERINGIKNSTGFPYNTIENIKKKFLINNENFEVVIIDKTKLGAKLLMEFGDKPKSYQEFFKKKTIFHKIFRKLKRFVFSIQNPQKKLANKVGLSKFNIEYFDHHLCHAASACLFSGFDEKLDWLIFTMDAEGDNLSSTVYEYTNESLKIISSNDRNKSLGYIYSYTTEYLGMRPNEHEFKVMGMAPYGSEERKKIIAQKLNNRMVSFDEQTGQFVSNINFKKFRDTLNQIYKNESFKDICAGVQFYLDEITCCWVNYWIKKKKINRISLAGGVFMNIKSAKKISELSSVTKQFVVPSCGDESLVFGAIYLKNKNKNIKSKKIKNLYLGDSFTDKEIYESYKMGKWEKFFKIEKFDSQSLNSYLAESLSEKKIIGRFCGRSEWGARALGNRSILCDPRKIKNIELLNQKIKSRDYWMPFAPSILEEDIDLFIINNKKINTEFMQMSFDSTDYAKKNIPAAIHPKDFTLRPQVVTKVENAKYYELIEKFKELSNVGCILNTSFNLHGNPNVGKPEHAFFTFKNSGLDILAIEDYIFFKKN